MHRPGRRRSLGGGGEPATGRRAARSPLPTSPGGSGREGLFPLSLLFQEKGAGEEEEKLTEGLAKVAAGPRCVIAERSRAAAGGSGAGRSA